MVHDIRTFGLSALLSFYTVARLGGVTAAARHLGMAKSGVSRHVSQLEAHYGVRLLERGGRSVRLTPIGETLSQRIRSILAEVDLLEDIAREESSGVAGQVTIATTPEFARFVAPFLLPELRLRHPGLKIVFRPAYDFEDLQDPGTDLAFRLGSFVDDRLVAIELGDVRLCLVAAPEVAQRHPLVVPEDLNRAPCLIFSGTQPNGVWSFFLGETKSSIEVSGNIAIRSFEALFDLAVAGDGYAFLPHFMLGEAIDSGKLVACLTEYHSRPYTAFMTFRPGARGIARVDAALNLAEDMIPKKLLASIERFAFEVAPPLG